MNLPIFNTTGSNFFDHRETVPAITDASFDVNRTPPPIFSQNSLAVKACSYRYSNSYKSTSERTASMTFHA